jgi:hypothetical protein
MLNLIGKLLVPSAALSAALASVLFCSQVVATGEDEKKEEETRRQQKLEEMKRIAAQYTVSSVDESKRKLKLHDSAIFRFSNPVGGAKDGAIYLWCDRGRPQAVLKLYTYDNERFSHEWQSLAENSLLAERNDKVIWNPTEPGISFREFPDAPKPAESAAERSRQMKVLVGKFSSTYTDIPRTAKPVDLRLLTQPLYRSEAAEAADKPQFLDSSLFAFAQGTAPPALLLLEARRTGDGYRWHYAFAKISSGAVAAKLGEKEVYSVEKYDFSRDPKKTFLWLPPQAAAKQ